ncbi:MAG: DUF1456 family protein [Xanthomonadales bacterium]|jgi:uncharacterized protein YehS (DUF1456 family)|nr:DUF1456 family protein [Xanthomonadales bacterium]
MMTNDVLRSVRYLLDLSDARIIEIAQLSDPELPLDRSRLLNFLKKEGEPGFEVCDDRTLLHFLDGLILHRRGRDLSKPPRPVEARISNNLVLKKLRVAFELQDADMHQAFVDAGFPVSKPELSALFRHHEHKNYRACGDQMLRNFLKGLTLRLRGG